MSITSSAAGRESPATVEVTIERILPGGVGLAHAEGRTLFVALAAPGDVLRVRIDRVRGKVAFASIVEIVKPSPVRVEPPCPYFGACGGCDFQQLTYEAQLNAKVEIIRDCLRRIAQISPPPEIPITPSPHQWHYRSRANWQFDPRERKLGYFARGSHRVCDVAECAVLAPELQHTFAELRQSISSLPEDLQDIEIAGGDKGVSVSPRIDGLPAGEIARNVGGESYQFDAQSFFQINHELLEPLILEATKQASGETAVDLYCGVGLFTVPLARRFAQVVGVEANAHAAAFARRNLDQARLSNSRIVTQPVSEWLQVKASSVAPVDLVLLDPPRTGVEEDAINGLIDLKPLRIVYVSCDPATLARDLRALLAGGYRLDSVAAFDMFPQTHHVETVAHLSLNVSGNPKRGN